MIKYEEMVLLREKIKYLSNGIDPLSKIPFPNDTILMSRDNQRTFSQVEEILDRLLRVEGKIEHIDKRFKCPFFLTKEQIMKVEFSEKPIPISNFAYSINNVVNTAEMKKIQATQITKWLLAKGYLNETEHEDGKIFKVLTDTSSSIGLMSEAKENSIGRKYEVILYNLNAQKFILENINIIAKTN